MVIVLVVFEAVNLSRPLPVVGASAVPINISAASSAELPWPTQGQAAIGTLNDGLLETHGQQTPAPIASISKVIAALAVLNKYPLATDQQGPTITLGQADVDSFNYYYLHDGSVAQVTNGEQITEYQALQAMLLPSANNMADSLTNWAFGSSGTYIDYANQMVKQMGLKNTTVGGASGFHDDTLSTAADLVVLAQAAMKNQVIADIVGQTEAVIPVAGTIHNVDWLLGEGGVIGIKTGNTDKAGGCFMFAAKHTVHGQPVTVIGAVVGDTKLNQALIDSQSLIAASDSHFRLVGLKHGQVVGRYRTSWGAQADAVAQKDVNFLVWRNGTVKIKPILKSVGAAPSGTNVGNVEIIVGNKIINVPAQTDSAIEPPSIIWQLTH